MIVEDADYVARCLTGDTEAYSELVKRYDDRFEMIVADETKTR